MMSFSYLGRMDCFAALAMTARMGVIAMCDSAALRGEVGFLGGRLRALRNPGGGLVAIERLSPPTTATNSAAPRKSRASPARGEVWRGRGGPDDDSHCRGSGPL